MTRIGGLKTGIFNLEENHIPLQPLHFSDGNHSESFAVDCDVWLHFIWQLWGPSSPNAPPDKLCAPASSHFSWYLWIKGPAPLWVERCLKSQNPNHIVNSWELSASACPPPPWWNEAKYSILVRENIQISSLLRNRAVCFCAVGVVTDLTTRGEQIEIIYLVICGLTVPFQLPNFYIFIIFTKNDIQRFGWSFHLHLKSILWILRIYVKYNFGKDSPPV